MSTVVNDRNVGDRRLMQRRAEDRVVTGRRPLTRESDGMRVGWGGIWAGVLVVLATLILLTTLGLAVGISAVDPRQPDAQALGTGAAAWAGVSMLLALFIGGMVSTRIGLVYDKATGAYEGALVWVLSILVMLLLAGSGIGLVAGGAFKLVGGATQTIGTMVQGADGSGLSEGTVDQIVQRLNDPQTARTLSAATGMPQDQLQSDLAGIAQRVQGARDDPARAAAEARQGQQIIDRARSEGRMERAAENVRAAASATAWITFAALVLSLVAAVLGAMSGRRAGGRDGVRARLAR